ncbi:LexA family transcriptional regulator [Lysinibacillus sp. AR18-8]|uniref:LexA family protein n=1 Tax=Lysinibacillus sp. AR18-8 TaxID=1889781 RepID=UPI0009F5661A|nr:XRE family transcriptional regulator [Lysinibacillus sp. AR18-8]
MKDTTKLVFSKNLESLLSKTGKTVSDLSNDIGISYSTVSDWKNGKKMPRGGSLQTLADYFNVNLSSLLEEKKTNLIELSQPSSEYTYFPVHASAGVPIRIDSLTDAETITIPDAVLGRHAGDDELFFMRVNGDSMNKVIPHQSLIGVKPIQINELKDEDIIVYSDGYNYSVKRFYRDGNRLIFRPESYDASFTDYTVSEPYEDLRLHGKVVIYIVNLD